MTQENSVIAPSKPTNILPFERDNDASAPDRSTLSAGAKKIRDSFTPEDRRAIIDAKPLDAATAKQQLEKVSRKAEPSNLDLAVIIAGLEKGNAGEIAASAFLNAIQATYPNLPKVWVKHLREAVKNVRGASARSATKGTAVNVVNVDDFPRLCGYAVKALQDANKLHPTLFERASNIVEVSTGTGISVKDVDLYRFTAKVNLATPFRKSFGTGDSAGYQEVSCPDDVAKFLYNCDLLVFAT